MTRIFGPNTTYVTILRDPLDAVLSSWAYYKSRNSNTSSLAKFLDDCVEKGKHESCLEYHDHIRKDFGISNLLTSDYNDLKEALNTLESQFDLVMITEHFDESLVLMADSLGKYAVAKKPMTCRSKFTLFFLIPTLKI